jgi:ubiquinone/menaquinone biosynthesis C-methylase UbiE
LKFVLDFIEKNQIKSVLIVGATPSSSGESFVNLIERGLLNACDLLVASGLEEKSDDWKHWVSADGRNLPFGNKEFDLVFSNAVIEHVGALGDQENFVQEHVRVGRYWILTTPNRMFPIESHTHMYFKHMKKGWNHPHVSRLLSKKDLKSILPVSAKVKGFIFSPTLMAHN